MNGIAYTILCWLLLKEEGPDSKLAAALGKDWKGKLSLVIYALGIAIAFYKSWLGMALYVVVSIIWFIPDQRIEKAISGEPTITEEP
jgi:hypothetical protein